MSDVTSRVEDLERTDVLPQLTLEPTNATGASGRSIDQLEASANPANNAIVSAAALNNSRIQTLPAKPHAVSLELGGIRGKLADLETKLHETQDEKVDLTRQCQQLEMRSRASEQRAIKAEADCVLQTAELSRVVHRAQDAEQRLNEQRVRLEAQLADIERQLLDARARGDKRSLRLEQQLNQESDRAAQSDHDAATVRMDLDKLRAELETTRTSLESLQERAAKQTKAAADISRLYAQQSKQAEVFSASMEKSEQHIARVQTAKAESDRIGAELQLKLRAANDDIAKLQVDVERQRRTGLEIQSQIEARDVQVTQLLDRTKSQEITIHELQLAKHALEADTAQLRDNLRNAQIAADQRQAQAQRLEAEIHQQEERIHALEASNSKARADIADRDQSLTAEKARVLATDQRHGEAREQIRTLEVQATLLQTQIAALQSEVQVRNTESAENTAAIEILKREHASLMAAAAGHQSALHAQQATIEQLEGERDHIEMEHRVTSGELMQTSARYEEAVQAIITAREAISVREQRNLSLETELHATIARLHDSNARMDASVTAVQAMSIELRERDIKIAELEQKLAEHGAALSAIGQDIERVNSAHPSEAFAALGYALESIDTPGVSHRITRATTTVGRSISNDISIDSTSVSRYHARLLVKPEGVWLVDLQSTNGCGVNGRRASRQILCDGDAILIGHCRFRFATSAIETRVLEQREQVQPVSLSQVSPNAANSSHLHH